MSPSQHRPPTRPPGRAPWLAAWLALGLLAAPAASRAATFTVINTNDSGTGSLRQAIADAGASADTASVITFNLTAPSTITLTSGELSTGVGGRSLDIQGPGASALTVNGNSEAGAFRVFHILGGAVQIENLTIANGNAGGANGASGGGVLVDPNGGSTGTTLVLTGCTVTGCSSAGSGGGVYSSGGALTLNNCTVSGNSSSDEGGGVFDDAGTFTMNNTTVSGNTGNSNSGGVGEDTDGPVTLTACVISGNSNTTGGGAGLDLYGSGPTTLTDCTVSGNTSRGTSSGGGILVEGGTTVTLVDSVVSGNTASQDGGGLSVESGAMLTLTDCTVSGNLARNTGESMGGGGLYNAGTLVATGTTFSGNLVGNFSFILESSAREGALPPPTFNPTGDGGAIVNTAVNGAATVTLTNCTLANNQADLGGAILSVGSLAESGGPTGGTGLATVTLTSCTVSGNTAGGDGGGLYVGSGVFALQGTIVAGNTVNDAQSADVFSGPTGLFTSNGSNFIGISDGSTGFTNGVNNDQVGTQGEPADPKLDPGGLKDNGGPTQTIALESGSPAIDADLSAAPPATDQRGIARPQGARADIGAFEVLTATPDTTPPVTTAVANGSPFFNGYFHGPVTVTLTATDTQSDILGTFYRIDSGPKQTYTGPFQVTGDFTHFVTFYSIDTAGNAEGPAKSATFSIDSAPPVTTITAGDAPGGKQVTLVDRDNFSGPGSTFYRIDSGPLHPYTGPFLVTGQFQHLVTAYSIDQAGNAENPAKSLTFTIGPPPPADTTPPVTTVSLAGTSGANGYYRSAVTVTLAATDTGGAGLAGTFYRIDSGAQQTYTGPFPVSGDFKHLVTFYSTDKAGNAEGPAKSTTFTIDATPPVTTITAGDAPGGKQVTLAVHDNFSGPAQAYYRVDSGPLQTYTGPFLVTGQFQHLVTAYSVDQAGNAENPAKSLTFTLAPPKDTTPPVTTATVTGIVTGPDTFRRSATVTFTATDTGGSGVGGTLYRIDGGPLNTYAGPFSVTGLGSHTVTFASVDNAGNVENPPKSVTFTVSK